MKNKLPRLPMLIVVLALIALALPLTRSSAPPTVSAPPETAVASTAAPPATTQPQPPVARKPPAIGDQLLTQAALRLERRASVSARIRHQVFLDGTQLSGIGSYWQQGAGEELRVRLELQIIGQEANLLQVSDSRFLWLERKLPTGRTVSRIDLRQLRSDPSLTPANLDGPEPGSATWSSTESLIAHTGGLPSLLASLGENFEFLPPQAMRLAAESIEDPQATSIPVFAVVGHWREEKLNALLRKSGESKAESGEQESPDSRLSTPRSIPARLPQEVLLLVGQADLFPYRIEYRKLETPPANPDGPPIPYQLSTNPMVVLDLIEVAFDVPVETGQFDYAPGDTEWFDQTATVLQRIRQQRDQLAGRAIPTHK